MSKLAISRYPGESVFLGNDIKVKVVSVKGSKVKLCIYAPHEVDVFREEIAKNWKRREDDHG